MNEIKTTKKTNKKGFTLVELVVVIAILAILAAIAIPVVSNTIASSARSGALSDAQTLELALKEADAMIQAGDTSAGYSTATTVANVVAAKSLQSIDDTVNVAGTSYTLSWCAADDKCYYIDSSGANLDSNVTPGGSCTALSVSSSNTISSLF